MDTPSARLLKKYLEQGWESETVEDSVSVWLPRGEIVINTIDQDVVGGVRVSLSITAEGSDYAEDYRVKIRYLDLLTFIYEEKS